MYCSLLVLPELSSASQPSPSSFPMKRKPHAMRCALSTIPARNLKMDITEKLRFRNISTANSTRCSLKRRRIRSVRVILTMRKSFVLRAVLLLDWPSEAQMNRSNGIEDKRSMSSHVLMYCHAINLYLTT